MIKLKKILHRKKPGSDFGKLPLNYEDVRSSAWEQASSSAWEAVRPPITQDVIWPN